MENTNSSCDINAKNSCCCSSEETTSTVDLKAHWNKAYTNNPEEKLGWFETDLSPMFQLINQINLQKNASIINIGAGSTTLIDELIKQEYSNIIATDISDVALKNLEERVGTHKIKTIVDDLTKPSELTKIDKVDLWIDRAVLHFFTETKDQDTYFDLLKSKIKDSGYVILAEFSLQGATKCSGLDVHRYDEKMLLEKLGSDFQLIEAFHFTYTMPSGDPRDYIYTLFRKIA